MIRNLLKVLRKRRSEIIERRLYQISTRDALVIDQQIERLNAKQHQPDKQVKVGFVVQMPEIWNKEAPLFDQMLVDQRFDPWLIVVPAYNLVRKRRGNYGKELEFFKLRYPHEHILTEIELSQDFSGIAACAFDYIFFQRCWELYLPKSLTTHEVIKHSKTCYVPYFYQLFEEPHSYYETQFFSNLYIMFCSNDSEQTLYAPKGNRKSVSIGYPCLSNIQYVPPVRHQKKTILWTPRWETSLKYGGSTFFDYRTKFILLKEKYPECQVLLRPHPLTFEKAVLSGQMSKTEVDEYKKAIEKAGVLFDTNASIDDTLPQIDILISDYSSILIDALLCGKPIIYCGKEMKATPNEFLRKILDTVYYTSTWDEVEKNLNMLLQDIDPLESARAKLAQSFVEKHRNSSAHITEYLYHDYQKTLPTITS